MKYLAIVTIAISLICVAQAFTFGVYSDAQCSNLLPASDLLVLANPWITELNQCTQRGVKQTGRSEPNWFKITSCTASRFTGAVYSDSNCLTKTLDLDTDFVSGRCSAQGGGVQFVKLSCSATDTLAVHAAVAAATALLLFVQ